MNKIVVLDRDGVINEDSDAFIKSADEWQPIPGSLDAIARLHDAGYRVVIATNQSGITRRLLSEQDLSQIHQKLTNAVEAAGGMITAIVYCPHGPGDQCACRKPKPGLLQQLAQKMETTLTGCWSVGDSLRDLQAAYIEGLQPALVRTGKGTKTEKELPQSELAATPVFNDLADFVDQLLVGKL